MIATITQAVRRLRSAARIFMEPTESRTHSFIIKIWLEEDMDEAGRTVWRGHITHVPGGERRYLKQLNDVLAFIMPFLKKMGVRFDMNSRGPP
jgi:hypothetical protein